MERTFTIGELGKQTGLPPKTIRFYEEISLIAPARRAANGYRIYDKTAIEELKVIKDARDLGLPVERIKRLMKGCENGRCEHSREYLYHEIADYMSILDGKIKEMTTLRDKLRQLRSTVTPGKPGVSVNTKFFCDILHQITELEKGGDCYGRLLRRILN